VLIWIRSDLGFYEVVVMFDGDYAKVVLLEKERLANLNYWLNDPRSTMLHRSLSQLTLAELENVYSRRGDEKWWLIESKRGSLVGFILNRPQEGYQVVEYLLEPEDGEEVHALDAVKILVQYLFMNYGIVRIQGELLVDDFNGARVLEANGFVREGVKRNSVFRRGEWKDSVIFGLLREEWPGPSYDWD
jgi:RimJ/RimL family protein N-acetyltransferase